MPPGADDPSIPDEANLLRVLHPRWITFKGGRERPTTDSFKDSNFENSCFVEAEITIEELQRLFPEMNIARVPARVVRATGFAIERRPTEAPENCSNPRSHVVVGPTEEILRTAYEAIKNIVLSPAIEIVRP